MRRSILIALTIGIVSTNLSPGHVQASGIPVVDVANVANTLLISTQQLQQINNQLQMLANLDFSAAGQINAALSQTLSYLDQIEDLAYSVNQFEGQYNQLYPSDMGDLDYSQLIALKDKVLNQTIAAQKHAMQMQSAVASSIPQSQGTVQDILDQSNNAPGAKAAVQANSQLLAVMSSQMAQTQTLLLTQARAQNAAVQEEKAKAKAAAELKRRLGSQLGGEVPTSQNGEALLSFE